MSLNFVFSYFDSSLVPLFLFLSFLYLIIIKRAISKNTSKLPPSPPKLPFIGNLHQLLSSPLPHRSLHSLSKEYGPLMLLQVGQVPTLIVSSPAFAQEVMKTHDAVFASRPSMKAARIMLSGDLTFSPYGDYWKQLRKICVNHLLGSKLVQSFRRVREEEVAFMIDDISATCSSLGSVDMSELLRLLTNNIVCRAVLGKSFRGGGKNAIFCELTEELAVLLGTFCVGDYFPLLGWLDTLLGFERRARRNSQRWSVVLDEVIDDHVKELKDQDYNKPEKKDFVDVLLDLESDISAEFAVKRELIKILVLDMIGAGTDTSFIALEWGMAELIRNPKVMKKLQDEARGVANKDSMIREEDLSKMAYLRAVIKEILRLHPSASLLIPHESRETCTIRGCEIPKKTRVIVNAWAISRDPEFWDAPEEFQPERFMNSSVDFKGHDFEFIPFGAGRRACPGLQFATSTLGLALANLVLRFDWTLPGGEGVENVDMSESPGLTTRKKEKLNLVAKPAVVK